MLVDLKQKDRVVLDRGCSFVTGYTDARHVDERLDGAHASRHISKVYPFTHWRQMCIDLSLSLLAIPKHAYDWMTFRKMVGVFTSQGLAGDGIFWYGCPFSDNSFLGVAPLGIFVKNVSECSNNYYNLSENDVYQIGDEGLHGQVNVARLATNTITSALMGHGYTSKDQLGVGSPYKVFATMPLWNDDVLLACAWIWNQNGG